MSSLDTAAPATATQIPDDPAKPSESNVHYLSDTKMSFDIDESLNLQGGVDIVATNPDGTRREGRDLLVHHDHDPRHGPRGRRVRRGRSLNLETPKPGTEMNLPRRGLVSAAAKATSAARFVFAVAGDDGGANVYNSVESAPVDLSARWGAGRSSATR